MITMSNLKDELMAIRAEHGQLTAALIVAKQLIRVVKETYIDRQGNPDDVRFFHAIPREDAMVYEPLPEIIADDLATKILLSSMEREWRSLRKRYEKFTEFRSMVIRDLGEGEAA